MLSNTPPSTAAARIHLDAYYTPLDLARRLVRLLPIGRHELVLEPHVGGGSFARAVRESTDARLHVRDVNPDAPGLQLQADAHGTGDFLRWRPNLDADPQDTPALSPDWVLGNPPYGDVLLAHVAHALRVSRRHVAMLVRTGIFESQARIDFWAEARAWLRGVWVLAQRPSFRTDSKGTDSYSYAWIWWDKAHAGPLKHFVPCWDWKHSPSTQLQLLGAS